MNIDVGFAGEFRCVVTSVDGTIKSDTGFQKNLILDNGLDYLGVIFHTEMLDLCAVGSGSSTPTKSQLKLDSLEALAGKGSVVDYDYGYSESTGDFYKTSATAVYSFTTLTNANVTEVGLLGKYTSETNYEMCTRALIKDSLGNPTSISVLEGEVLNVYYKLWQVFSTVDNTGQINILDGKGGGSPVAYNYIARLGNVGIGSYYGVGVGKRFSFDPYGIYSGIFTGDMGVLAAAPSTSLVTASTFEESTYVKGTFTKVMTLKYDINQVFDVRGVVISGGPSKGLGYWQIRFGSVADDSPIIKTNKEKLEIPVQVSWGRYEGALE